MKLNINSNWRDTFTLQHFYCWHSFSVREEKRGRDLCFATYLNRTQIKWDTHTNSKVSIISTISKITLSLYPFFAICKWKFIVRLVNISYGCIASSICQPFPFIFAFVWMSIQTSNLSSQLGVTIYESWSFSRYHWIQQHVKFTTCRSCNTIVSYFNEWKSPFHLQYFAMEFEINVRFD